MFAFKSWTERVARVITITTILFTSFLPVSVSAGSQVDIGKTTPATNSSDGLMSSISLGDPASQLHQEVPFLSERIAKEAQQQEEKPIGFKVSAEPAIYVPRKPISLRWKLQNTKSEDIENGEIVIHTSPGVTPTDPTVKLTPEGLVSIPLSSKKDVSEWNITEEAEFPIYFTLELLLNGNLLTYETVMIDQPRFSVDKSTGGTIKSLDDKVELEVPPGAMDESLDFDIRGPAPNTLPGVSLTWEPVEIVAVGKNSQKNIDKFKSPIKIKMKYDEARISDWDEDALTLYYYDPDQLDWFPIETTVDTKNNTLTAYSDHLTIFDYKANNWQSQSLPTVDAFKVSDFTGAGTYAINLWTPLGPNGLQPSLTLSYNSQVIDKSSAYSQPSWVGMGWELDTGAITRNMHGTNSDTSDDTFSISAGGVSGLLLSIDSVSVGGTTTTTYNTVDQSFMKVEYEKSSTSDKWTAWSTDGTKYEFASIARTSTTDTDGCSTVGQLDLVWRWSLTKITDTHGNQLSYSYTVEKKNSGGGCYNEIAVYPLSISYPNGKYSVSFVAETRNDYQTSWTQNASRTLYGTKRLKEVLVQHLGATVRRYAFSYAPDTATSNVIYPKFKWSHANAKTLTLRGVQEFSSGALSPALPAVTFTYEDGLHVTDVDNGQGGQVHIEYERWTYFDDLNDDLRSLLTVFGTESGTHPECIYSGGNWIYGTAWTRYSGGTVTCRMDGSIEHLQVGYQETGQPATAAVALRSIPENVTKPGGRYRVAINGGSFTGGVDINWGFVDQSQTPWGEAIRYSEIPNPGSISLDASSEMPIDFNPQDLKTLS